MRFTCRCSALGWLLLLAGSTWAATLSVAADVRGGPAASVLDRLSVVGLVLAGSGALLVGPGGALRGRPGAQEGAGMTRDGSQAS